MNLCGNDNDTEQPWKGQNSFSNLANWISVFGFAPVLSIPAFILIILSGAGSNSIAIEVSVALLFGFLLPSLIMYSFVKVKGISYDDRESRITPLLSVAAVYFTGTLVLAALSEPASATILMLCYGTNTLTMYFISRRWKISVHAMGVAGPTTALIFYVGTMGGTLGLLMLPVVWSRLYLGKHTPDQVLSGGLLGYSLTGVQFFLIENFVFHESTGGLAVPLSFMVLALPLITLTSYSSSRSFRLWFSILILNSTSMGYLMASSNLIHVDYLLAANLILFTVMLFLPASENSKNRIVQNLLHRKNST